MSRDLDADKREIVPGLGSEGENGVGISSVPVFLPHSFRCLDVTA